MMTDAEKLAKLDEAEQKAWDGTWMKWSTNGRERDIRDRLEIIERCQRIRENLEQQMWDTEHERPEQDDD